MVRKRRNVRRTITDRMGASDMARQITVRVGAGTNYPVTVTDDSGQSDVASATGTGSGIFSLPRIPWEGGPAYWAQYPRANTAGWTDPNFFPMAVWLSDPQHAAELRSIGVNIYMAANHTPPMSTITNTGMFVMAGQDEWTVQEVGNNPNVVAWFISDECEMGNAVCVSDDETVRYNQQLGWTTACRALNDGRFMWANYGNGILRTFWANGTRPMPMWISMVDGSSADKYTYTSPFIWGITPDSPDWPPGAPVSRACSYGWQVDQMRRFQDPTHLRPIWTFVETAMPWLTEPGALTITPAQAEGAVWSAIIHEARGVAWFQHNNDGINGDYSLVECSQARQDQFAAIMTKVRNLAPVLNTQSYYNATRTWTGMTYPYYTFNNGTDTALKIYNGNVYVIAGIGMLQSPGTKTFVLPAGVTGTTVTVVGEGRTIPVSNRQFSDSFAYEYTHHVYQVAI